jgi:hypothetical protein
MDRDRDRQLEISLGNRNALGLWQVRPREARSVSGRKRPKQDPPVFESTCSSSASQAFATGSKTMPRQHVSHRAGGLRTIYLIGLLGKRSLSWRDSSLPAHVCFTNKNGCL